MYSPGKFDSSSMFSSTEPINESILYTDFLVNHSRDAKFNLGQEVSHSLLTVKYLGRRSNCSEPLQQTLCRTWTYGLDKSFGHEFIDPHHLQLENDQDLMNTANWEPNKAEIMFWKSFSQSSGCITSSHNVFSVIPL